MKPLLLILSLVLALTGCSERRHARRTHATKTVAVHHLPDGRYAYQDDNGTFWFYMYMSQSSHTETYYVSSAANALPRGGGWVSANSPSVTPAAVQSAEKAFNEPETEVVQESVEVNPAGEPMSLSEAVENAAYDGTDAHADGMSDSDSSSSSSDSSSSSSDSGSSSSDSGSSGGDGGGGGSGD